MSTVVHFSILTEFIFAPQFFCTDASRNGILGCGGVCGQNWFRIQWDYEFIAKKVPSINYLELYALTVGVVLWIRNFKNQNITIFCDNQSVLHMVNNTSSKDRNCMVLLRLITMECLTNNVKLKVKYIPSKKNTLADMLSRMRYQDFIKELKRQKLTMNTYPDEIPDFLWPMEDFWLEEN